MRSFARLANADFALWIGRENIRSAPAWTLYVQEGGVSAHGGGRQSASEPEGPAVPMKAKRKKRFTIRHRGRQARRKMQQATALREKLDRERRRQAEALAVVAPSGVQASAEVKIKRRKAKVASQLTSLSTFDDDADETASPLPKKRSRAPGAPQASSANLPVPEIPALIPLARDTGPSGSIPRPAAMPSAGERRLAALQTRQKTRPKGAYELDAIERAMREGTSRK